MPNVSLVTHTAPSSSIRPVARARSAPRRCSSLVGRAELVLARAVAATHRLPLQETKATHNLAWLDYLDGDLPRALVGLRAAHVLGSPDDSRVAIDLAQVLAQTQQVEEVKIGRINWTVEYGGPDLTFATAQVAKVQYNGGGQGNPAGGYQQPQQGYQQQPPLQQPGYAPQPMQQPAAQQAYQPQPGSDATY